MNQAAKDAVAFLQRLSALAERLANQELVVTAFRADWACFGSWAIEVEKGHRALRAVWDGKEQLLTVDTAPTAAGAWTRELEHVCQNNEDAVRMAEEHILRSKF